jgi:hypothetical protein
LAVAFCIPHLLKNSKHVHLIASVTTLVAA